MSFSRESVILAMKYSIKEIVNFKFNGKVLRGEIKVCDFGGSFEHTSHSYDIYVSKSNTWYKHILEEDIF